MYINSVIQSQNYYCMKYHARTHFCILYCNVFYRIVSFLVLLLYVGVQGKSVQGYGRKISPFKNIEYKFFVENKGDRVLADYWSLAEEEELQSLKSVLPERQKGGNLV